MKHWSSKDSGSQRADIAALDDRQCELEDRGVKGVRRGLEELPQEKRQDICSDDVERRNIFDELLKFGEDHFRIVAQIDGPKG